MHYLFINTLLLMIFLFLQTAPVLAEKEWKGCGNVSEIPLIECEALTALCNSTNGEKWKNNKGWLQTNTPCSWHGISCSSGNVTRISLNDNQLNGSIPAALSKLSKLWSLTMHDNQLRGSIPPTLGNLSGLRELWLFNNQLSGEIPPELGKLSKLKRLHLGHNRLNGSIPSELGTLSLLEELNLGSNRLTGEIPPELGKLSALQRLHLSNNSLSGSIPTALGNLISIKTIWMGGNQLSGSIPSEFGRLSSLWSLILSGNHLDGSIPSQFGNLGGLETLNLSKNQLSGAIPPEFGRLSSLKSLLLGGNRLSGPIPPELGYLYSLENLSLGNNQLSGGIPPELGKLSALKSLWMPDNRLSGSIPSELGNLSSIEEISLGNNQLSGKIPPELGKLTSLRKLLLYNNNRLNKEISRMLTVQSSGLADHDVEIVGKPKKYTGTTDYSVGDIENGTLIYLTAPATAGSWLRKERLVSWTGCDFMFGRTCTVKMLSNKTVTVKYASKDRKAADSGNPLKDLFENLKEFDEKYDSRNSEAPDVCNSMEIVLKNPEKLDVRYIVTSYDPIGHSGQYASDPDGTRIPKSISIISTADALRGVEWRKYTDAPLYTIIVDEKCDGSTTRHVQPIGLGGMMQEDSTSFEDMKARIIVTITSSLSAADEAEARRNFP